MKAGININVNLNRLKTQEVKKINMCMVQVDTISVYNWLSSVGGRLGH